MRRVASVPVRSSGVRRAVQLAVAFIAMVSGLWLLWLGRGAPPETPDKWARRLGLEHGVTVGFGPPTSFFVAPFQASDAALVETVPEPVDPSALPLALDGLGRALSQYPPGF